MTTRSSSPSRPPPERFRAYVLEDRPADPYAAKGRYRSPLRCPDCGAAYLEGRWQWAAAPGDAPRHRCPACQRIADGMPAGVLRVEGQFALAHRADLVRTLSNEAERERSEHPLHRVIAIDEVPDGLEVKTTDIHLPQRLGEALRHAYKGELELRYAEHEYGVRATWRRG
jgi:hypothetical protein